MALAGHPPTAHLFRTRTRVDYEQLWLIQMRSMTRTLIMSGRLSVASLGVVWASFGVAIISAGCPIRSSCKRRMIGCTDGEPERGVRYPTHREMSADGSATRRQHRPLTDPPCRCWAQKGSRIHESFKAMGAWPR